ncbi:MAG: lipocalin family protein [Bdellovibrionia bacterium]
MKTLLLVSMFLGVISVSANASTVQTVESVDLTRYQGKWYEIATIPQSFQKKCLKNVTAEYKILNNGQVEVLNSCDTKSGRDVAEGRAKVVDSQTNAKLKVTFVKLFNWVFAFGGDYWIIDLEPNYQYVVVGHPTREYGWILARTPVISDADMESIKEKLVEQGYDLCKFQLTVQDGGTPVKESLCKN